jgi:hypothetical protein
MKNVWGLGALVVFFWAGSAHAGPCADLKQVITDVYQASNKHHEARSAHLDEVFELINLDRTILEARIRDGRIKGKAAQRKLEELRKREIKYLADEEQLANKQASIEKLKVVGEALPEVCKSEKRPWAKGQIGEWKRLLRQIKAAKTWAQYRKAGA